MKQKMSYSETRLWQLPFNLALEHFIIKNTTRTILYVPIITKEGLTAIKPALK